MRTAYFRSTAPKYELKPHTMLFTVLLQVLAIGDRAECMGEGLPSATRWPWGLQRKNKDVHRDWTSTCLHELQLCYHGYVRALRWLPLTFTLTCLGIVMLEQGDDAWEEDRRQTGPNHTKNEAAGHLGQVVPQDNILSFPCFHDRLFVVLQKVRGDQSDVSA